MTDVVKVALIAAAAVIAAVSIYIYFSPYQSCVRAAEANMKGSYEKPANAARIYCARNSN
jgi:hypothetical protein